MTYGETTVGQTIDRLLSEHPDLDASAEGALDNLDQFHAGHRRAPLGNPPADDGAFLHRQTPGGHGDGPNHLDTFSGLAIRAAVD